MANINDKRPLPTGWRWARLGELAEYVNGRPFKPEEWVTEGLPIIRIQNLNSPDAVFNHFNGKVDSPYRVSEGDLLVSWSASLDAYIWKGGPAVLNQHIFKVGENASLVDRTYLFFALREAMAEIRAQVHGATMRHITKPEFEAIEVPLPPLEDQKRIAAILNEQMAAVEQARAAAEAQLEAAKALPAAYLRAVFSNGDAQRWQKIPLGDVSRLLPSKSIATDGDAEVQAITTACLREGGFASSGIKTARMWAKDIPECTLARGEILVARSNTPELVGRVAMFPGEPMGAVASDLTIRILPTGAINSEFLTAYLSYLYQSGYWKERAGGASGTMKKITREQIQAEQVPLPAFANQERIAAILNEQMTSAAQARKAIEGELDAINKLPAALAPGV
jgi:type I restriction enzyme S subunit